VGQPTLHYLVSGKAKRCRASIRRGLARQFKIKEGWLAGDPNSAPFRDRNLARAERQGTIISPEERRQELPPLAELRVARLLEDCLRRWEQDVDSGVANLPDEGTRLGVICRNYSGEARIDWLGDFLETFLFGPKFLRLLIYGIPKRLGKAESELLHWYWKSDVDFTSAWVETLQALLGPWLEGHMPLDYEGCYGSLEAGIARDSQFFHRARQEGALEAAFPIIRRARSKPRQR
jgi:hypothetical protein